MQWLFCGVRARASAKRKSLLGRARGFKSHKLTEVETNAVIYYKKLIEMKAARRTVGDWRVSNS